MPDIRDVLKGLGIEERAIYTETRTAMRKAYLSAHSKILPIEKYNEQDDQFLDLIDIKIAQLFDRSGKFDNADGHIETETAKTIETSIKSKASELINKWN